ncbi:MAG: DUF721 domain-containing protein [Candidatus Moraniibacteriota bacterium]|nr:MAG: DUF721 domain-containing protein [Candidatus Moranbacteria bacterium]
MKSLGKFLSSKYVTKRAEGVPIDTALRSRTTKKIDEKTIFFLVSKVLEEEYGKRGAAMVRPSFFRDGKLFLKAKSSLWAEEMRLFAPELLERLTDSAGSAVLEIKVSHEYAG